MLGKEETFYSLMCSHNINWIFYYLCDSNFISRVMLKVEKNMPTQRGTFLFHSQRAKGTKTHEHQS